MTKGSTTLLFWIIIQSYVQCLEYLNSYASYLSSSGPLQSRLQLKTVILPPHPNPIRQPLIGLFERVFLDSKMVMINHRQCET